MLWKNNRPCLVVIKVYNASSDLEKEVLKNNRINTKRKVRIYTLIIKRTFLFIN